MSIRSLIVVGGLLLAAAAATGLRLHDQLRVRSYVYRYKLTLVVDTPEGPKSASSVVEETIQFTKSPAVGSREDEGEAVFVDLGPGRRPLIALLTDTMKSLRDPGRGPIDHRFLWHQGVSPTLIERLYEQPDSRLSQQEFEALIDYARKSGPRSISTEDLPDLVSLSDPRNPETMIEVSPLSLSDALGPGISLRSATFEITNEASQDTIETKLPFLQSAEWDCRLPLTPSGRPEPDTVDKLWSVNFETHYWPGWGGTHKPKIVSQACIKPYHYK